MVEKPRRIVQEEMYRFPYHYIVQFDPDGYGSFRINREMAGIYILSGQLFFDLEDETACGFVAKMVNIGR